jgi:ABC-2 type transport system ATP-binding protein
MLKWYVPHAARPWPGTMRYRYVSAEEKRSRMSDTSAKFWGAMAPVYDHAVDDSLGKSLRPAILDRLGREKGLGRVAEFGCGTGYFTAALARAAESVIATDISDEMLALAAQRLNGVPGVTLRNEDFMKPSFPDNAFDTVFMSLVLNLADDPAQALDQAHRVLKPGGTLFVAIPDWGTMDRADRELNTYRLKSNYEAASQYTITGNILSDKDLEQLLRNAGFRIVSFEVIRDVSDVTGSAIDYVKAVKSNTVPATTAFPRTIVEVGGPGRVIEVKHLTYRYGEFLAVFDVSFDVRKGEIFALLGPNGAGKTTTVEILECLKEPTKGLVNVLGDAVLTGIPEGNILMGADRDIGDIRERIGVLPQSFNAFDLLTVRENLAYFSGLYERHVDVDRLIDAMSLAEKKNVLFKNLSGGLKQRVGIAIALVNDPEIVFLDEPTAGLDPRARRDVWDLVKGLKARGRTVFLTTHYLDEAYNLADRICVIHQGSIVAEGSPDDLIDRYGGGNTLVFRECDAAAEALLSALPGSRRDGGDVLVKLPQEDNLGHVADVMALARACHCQCKEVYVKKSTLDDAFLNLTGSKLAPEEG